MPQSKVIEDRRAHWVYLFARLKPGVSLEQARARPERALPSRHYRCGGAAPERDERRHAREIPGARAAARGGRVAVRAACPAESRQPLTLLFSVTLIVLLICCANVANLLLGRAARRSTEMAVRLSIGAGRRHIVTQLLTESLLLAIAGGAGGLLVARWTLTAMSLLLPDGAGETLSLALDADMLLVAAGLSVAHRSAVRPVSGDSQHAAESGRRAQGQCGSAFRRKSGRALPRHARDGANRAVDGAARRCRAVREESLEHHAGRSGTEDRTACRVRRRADAQRLSAARNHEIFRRIEERLRQLPGVTGVTSIHGSSRFGRRLGQQFHRRGLFGRPGYRHAGDVQLRRTRLSPHARHSAASGREFTSADTVRHAEGRGRQRSIR